MVEKVDQFFANIRLSLISVYQNIYMLMEEQKNNLCKTIVQVGLYIKVQYLKQKTQRASNLHSSFRILNICEVSGVNSVDPMYPVFRCILFPFQDWLSKFGYLPPPDPVTGQLQTKEALTNAIKAMQKFGGLRETGVLGMMLCLFEAAV